MSLSFGRTRIRNFGRIIADNPRRLTKHPYLNFLRQYRKLNPKYNFQRLLKEGACVWRALKPHEKMLFQQKVILKHMNRRRVQPVRKRVAKRNNQWRVCRKCLPMRNIRRLRKAYK